MTPSQKLSIEFSKEMSDSTTNDDGSVSIQIDYCTIGCECTACTTQPCVHTPRIMRDLLFDTIKQESKVRNYPRKRCEEIFRDIKARSIGVTLQNFQKLVDETLEKMDRLEMQSRTPKERRCRKHKRFACNVPGCR